MKLIAVSRVKNEIDIVEAFVRHHVRHFDKLIIVDDGSTDGTHEVLCALQQSGLPLVVMREPEVGYFQSRQMTRLLDVAVNRFGADWVVPLDADEFVETADGTSLVEVLAGLPPGIYAVSWSNFVWSPEAEASEALNPVERLQHRMSARETLSKVVIAASAIAGKEATLAQGSHEIQIGGERGSTELLADVRLCHFPIRSLDQYAGKIAIGYLQYATIPHWDRLQGFHYIEAFHALCADPDLLRQRMVTDSRSYSVKSGAPADTEPVLAPLRYLGGPLVLTPRREWLLSNLLTYAEAMASELGKTRAEAEPLSDEAREAIAFYRPTIKRAEEAEERVRDLRDRIAEERQQGAAAIATARAIARQAARRTAHADASRGKEHARVVQLKAMTNALVKENHRLRRRTWSFRELARRLFGTGSRTRTARAAAGPVAPDPSPKRS